MVVNYISCYKLLPSHLVSHHKTHIVSCELVYLSAQEDVAVASEFSVCKLPLNVYECCKCRRDSQVMFDVKNQMSDKRAATAFGDAEISLCYKGCLSRVARGQGPLC